MDVAILVTNGGPHPPDKWASIAASKIADLIQVDNLSDSEAAAAARKAKPRFAIAVSEAVEPVFAAIMAAERDGVATGAIASRIDAFNVAGHLDGAVAGIVAQSGQFSGHFELPEVQQVTRKILTQLFLDAANIQRSWAFDAKGR